MLIEPAALPEPGYRVAEAAFAQARAQRRAILDGGIARRSRIGTFGADSTIHEVLVAASADPFLPEGLHRLIEYRTHQHRGRLVQECEDHLTSPDLVEAGRREDAAEFLRAHLDRARSAKAGIVAAGVLNGAGPGAKRRRTRV